MAARSPGGAAGGGVKVDAAQLLSVLSAQQNGLGAQRAAYHGALQQLQQQQLLQQQLTSLLAAQGGGGGGLFPMHAGLPLGGAPPMAMTPLFPNLTQPTPGVGGLAALQQQLQALQAAQQSTMVGALGLGGVPPQSTLALQALLSNHAAANLSRAAAEEAKPQQQLLKNLAGLFPDRATGAAAEEDPNRQALKQILTQSIAAIAKSNAALRERSKRAADSGASSNATSESNGPGPATPPGAGGPSTPKGGTPRKPTPGRGLNPAAPAFNPATDGDGGSSTPAKEAAAAKEKDPSLCHFFLRGMCAHGRDCRFSHDIPVVGANGAVGGGDAPPAAAAAGWRSPAPRVETTPPSSRRRSETRGDAARREQGKDQQVVPELSSFYLPSTQPGREFVVQPCADFNNGGCPDESWPHKLTHFYKDAPGKHETDVHCIYPNPRAHFRTCQVHHKLVWRWEPTTESWIQATPASQQLPPDGTLTVMTYNVLFDHYMKGHIHSRKRYQALLEVLREAQVDVVCLQEVQSAFLEELLEEEWVRHGYWSTAEPGCSSLNFAGVVVLSRYPLSDVSIHDLPQTCGNVSPSVVGKISLAPGFDVDLFSAHLSQSDVDVRACQLANLLRKTQASDFALLLGDFNIHALEPGRDYYDAWVESQPPSDEDGYTLSLTQNPMASLMAEHDKRSGADVDLDEVSGRFDHIFIKANPLIANTKRLNVMAGTAVVGGRDTCRHYLSRRFMRLCSYLGKNPDNVAAETGIADQVLNPAPTQDNTNITAPSAPETYGTATTQRLNHESLLKKTVAALKGLPEYLSPSDHYYLKVQIEAVVR